MRELIATAMRDHFGKPNSVCNHPDPRNDRLVQNQTIASSIVDLTAGDYYVAAGLPAQRLRQSALEPIRRRRSELNRNGHPTAIGAGVST